MNFADIKAADIGGDAADAIMSMSDEETQNDLKNDVGKGEKHPLPPTENKNISIDEMAEFEVRFKNAQMSLKFSKAEEACSEHTKLLIIS